MRKKSYALIGGSVSHSFSGELHALISGGKYEYELIRAKTAKEVKTVLSDKRYSGYNITAPHKQSVITLLDEVSDAAKRLGAVNTVKRLDDGRLKGYNTDLFGAAMLLKDKNITSGKTILLGTGGAAAAAAAALEELGATNIVAVSRNPSKTNHSFKSDKITVCSYSDLSNHTDACCIINATPVGMYPHRLATPMCNASVRPQDFRKLIWVIDLIYRPYRTKFMQDFERAGARTASGMEMLIYQGIAAERIWQDAECDFYDVEKLQRSNYLSVAGVSEQVRSMKNISAAEAKRDAHIRFAANEAEYKKTQNNITAAEEQSYMPSNIVAANEKLDPFSHISVSDVHVQLLKKQLNIVLIGMPGSGKSCIARRLARITGREFIDIDAVTKKLMGESIANVLENPKKGEAYMRSYEKEAIKQNCLSCGKVIATGGGSILRQTNRDYIRANSIVVYLKRPLKLLAKKNRPLSKAVGVAKLYHGRKRIYEKLADITVVNSGVFGTNKRGGSEDRAYQSDIGNTYDRDIMRFCHLMKKKIDIYIENIVKADRG